MIEKVVDQYIEQIKADVLNDQMQDIPLAYLMQKDLPESIKHYFDQEVENWILEEEEKFESSDRFDYDMPEVRMKIDEIFDFLKQSATFSLNKFNQLLERAIKLEKDFLVKPQQTMANFLFRDGSTIRTKQVNDTLRYFFVHTYYKEKLTEYFNLKYLQEINSEQFKVLIKEIDDKMFSSNMLEESKKLVQEIANFINQCSDEKDIISTEILVSAFKDRSIDEFTKLFQTLLDSGKTELSLEEIMSYLEDGIPEEKAQVSEEAVSVDDIDISSVKVEPEPEEEEEEEEEEDDEEDEEESEVETADSIPEESAAPSGQIHDSAADQLANIVSSQGNTTQNLDDLNNLIDKKWRKKFVKKMFKKDEDGFSQFIDTINSYQNWKDASLYIEDVFYERDVNPYSKEAITFSDIAYTRFFPKDEYVG